MTRWDAVEAVLGLGLLTMGVYLVSLPAALMVAGVILLGFACWPKKGGGG